MKKFLFVFTMLLAIAGAFASKKSPNVYTVTKYKNNITDASCLTTTARNLPCNPTTGPNCTFLLSSQTKIAFTDDCQLLHFD